MGILWRRAAISVTTPSCGRKRARLGARRREPEVVPRVAHSHSGECGDVPPLRGAAYAHDSSWDAVKAIFRIKSFAGAEVRRFSLP
jgi:hypothetical protein